MLKVSWDAHTPTVARDGLLEHHYAILGGAGVEVVLASLLLTGLWPKPARRAAIILFAVFSCIAGLKMLNHAQSCGCFGAVRVSPVYTLLFDILVVAALLALRAAKPEEATSVTAIGRGRAIVAIAVIFTAFTAFAGIELQWLSRTEALAQQGDVPGDEGSLVVLEPKDWAGKEFTLLKHIDIGSQLQQGRWVVLLVHHDCDHCAAAVPRYIQATSTANRLAVIEMPPYADLSAPPPWSPLPPTVLSGRLDETRDWFASTPVALKIEDGRVIKVKDGEARERDDISWGD